MASSTPHPAIVSVGRALPPNHVDQETLIAALTAYWGAKHFNVGRLADMHRNAGVGGRNLALPLAEYPGLDSFAKSNDAFIRVGLDVGEAAVRAGLARAGLSPADVDHLFFVTVTGISTPSLDARLANRLGLKPSVKRTPIFGLGCMAGAAGIARASDVLRAFPGEVAVMLSVELCSLTLQRDDGSVTNLVATGLFGDGAAAVVMAGGARANGARVPRIEATRSVFYPDTEWVMGWDVVDTGFKVVLSAKVPEVVESRIGGDVDAFLAAHGLAPVLEDVDFIVAENAVKVQDKGSHSLGQAGAPCRCPLTWCTCRPGGSGMALAGMAPRGARVGDVLQTSNMSGASRQRGERVMRTTLRLATMLLTLSFLAGCAGTIWVTDPPPPLRVEVRPSPPTEFAIWIDGYWAWGGNDYYWVPGHWERSPRGVWVPGRWEQGDRGYYWVKGHWDRGQGRSNRDAHDRGRHDHGRGDRGGGGY